MQEHLRTTSSTKPQSQISKILIFVSLPYERDILFKKRLWLKNEKLKNEKYAGELCLDYTPNKFRKIALYKDASKDIYKIGRID